MASRLSNEEAPGCSQGLRETDDGRAALSSVQHSTAAGPARQVAEPAHLAELHRAWQIAKAEGDRAGYELARRLFLLEQARLYELARASKAVEP